MTNTKTILWLSGVLGLLVLIPLCSLRWGIWLPDVLTRRTVVLDELTTTNGDYFRLYQRWIGDGYLTEFQHTNQQGRAWWFTIDGDAMKAWKGGIHQANENTLAIDLLKESFLYNMKTHAAVDRASKARWLLEIPEDGSKALVTTGLYSIDAGVLQK